MTKKDPTTIAKTLKKSADSWLPETILLGKLTADEISCLCNIFLSNQSIIETAKQWCRDCVYMDHILKGDDYE